MKKAVLEFVRSLCRPETEEGVLDTLCEAACKRLNHMMAENIEPEDCAEAYVPAAAWLVMDWLRESRDWEGVTALSAGDMTVRREGAGHGGSLTRRALELMAPYLKDQGFVFQGVRG